LQNIVTGMVYGVESLQNQNDVTVQQLVPDVHMAKHYRRSGETMFFKSHFLPRPEYRRVIYILRDGRDAMVSYWHYISAITGTEVDFLKFVTTGECLFPCKWPRHVTEWMQNPYNAEMIVIRYEDLLADPVREFKKLCSFAGLSRDDATLEEIAKATGFSVMQEREKKHGWSGSVWPKDRLFVRRGKVGAYLDEMPGDVLKAFSGEASAVLKQYGYIA